jgi:glycosyltransferase involved in cell wall biosynthesis
MFLPYWNKKFKFLRSIPKIVAMFHQPPSILESLLNIDIVRRVDHVLVVSPTQAEYFQQYLLPERIDTILLGVDTEHFKPGNPGKRNSKKFKCLAGGVWLRDYDAIFATAKLLQKIPGIEFHIVAPKIEIPVNMKNVFFHESIPDSALLDLYQNCDVLFLPMRDATANTFLLEGSACGLPVISSDLPSVKTYFPGEEAILIKNNDPDAFAGTLSDLYHDPQKLSRMSACARKRALELSWNKICKEYERLYMDIVSAANLSSRGKEIETV